jgi:hypothetical protein
MPPSRPTKPTTAVMPPQPLTTASSASGCPANELRAQQEVLRRVAADGQLREGDDVHAQLAGAAHVLEDPGDVAVQVTDSGVYLGQAYA